MKDINVKILKVVVPREECNFLTRPPKNLFELRFFPNTVLEL